MTRTRRMNADEIERILQNYGFEFVSQKGSHRKWRNVERQLQVIVPYQLRCRGSPGCSMWRWNKV